MRLPTQLSQRKSDSHKGDYGRLLILAGSGSYSGAGLLCAHAAIRSGAGMVTLGVPKGIYQAVIKNKPKEVITFPLAQTRDGFLSAVAYNQIREMIKKADVLIIGPGLGSKQSTFQLVRKIIGLSKTPTVLDADALNALSKNLVILRKHKGEFVLTPHEKEISRLFGLNISLVKKNRKLIAKKYARYYNSIIVLKGHNTLVTSATGQCYVNRTGNPGMATAGSGDVLSGIIGAFLAQGLNGFSAAKYAVYIHGLAGDIAAKDKTQISLIASDIIEHIPDAVKKCS